MDSFAGRYSGASEFLNVSGPRILPCKSDQHLSVAIHAALGSLTKQKLMSRTAFIVTFFVWPPWFAAENE